MEKRAPSCIVGGNVSWCSHSGEQYGVSLKKKKEKTGYIAMIWSSNPTPGNTSSENHILKRYMYPSVHHSTICNSQDMAAAQMFTNR